MAYTKTPWVNNNEPLIDATNLNKMEDGIFNNDALITKVLSAIGIATTTWSSSGNYDIDGTVRVAEETPLVAIQGNTPALGPFRSAVSCSGGWDLA